MNFIEEIKLLVHFSNNYYSDTSVTMTRSRVLRKGKRPVCLLLWRVERTSLRPSTLILVHYVEWRPVCKLTSCTARKKVRRYHYSYKVWYLRDTRTQVFLTSCLGGWGNVGCDLYLHSFFIWCTARCPLSPKEIMTSYWIWRTDYSQVCLSGLV